MAPTPKIEVDLKKECCKLEAKLEIGTTWFHCSHCPRLQQPRTLYNNMLLYASMLHTTFLYWYLLQLRLLWGDYVGTSDSNRMGCLGFLIHLQFIATYITVGSNCKDTSTISSHLCHVNLVYNQGAKTRDIWDICIYAYSYTRYICNFAWNISKIFRDNCLFCSEISTI